MEIGRRPTAPARAASGTPATAAVLARITADGNAMREVLDFQHNSIITGFLHPWLE